jgi:hypothetical protein
VFAWCDGPQKNHNFIIFDTNKIEIFGDIIGEGLVVKMCNQRWITSFSIIML